jgi:transcription termination/antitermination protein NusG
MMMQHNKLDGMPVAIGGGDRFEDRMRRIKTDMLHFAAIKAHIDSPWFAVRVMTGRERSVVRALDDANVEATVPMRMGPEYRRRGRVIPPSQIPVMTSYVLVRFVASDEAFLAMKGIEHVIDVLGGCASPRHISNEEVKRFRALAEGGSLDWERQTTKFRRGESVRVSDGPFAKLCGTIISCRDDGKGDAVVEMSLFSGTVPAVMPLAILQKV